NQVELLAKVVSRYCEIPVANVLLRIKETHPQFDLPKAERIKNVIGAFKVSDGKLVYNKTLLLLDDIYTTGATVAECSKVLKVAGARRVEVLTLARALEM
ncbi:MAG: ComF family protein, partial [Candidatus Margulisiibacteriota bacterium]